MAESVQDGAFPCESRKVCSLCCYLSMWAHGRAEATYLCAIPQTCMERSHLEPREVCSSCGYFFMSGRGRAERIYIFAVPCAYMQGFQQSEHTSLSSPAPTERYVLSGTSMFPSMAFWLKPFHGPTWKVMIVLHRPVERQGAHRARPCHH